MAVVALVILLPVPHAGAQDRNLQTLLDRIERLERDIATLNRQLARGETPGAPAGSGALAQPAGSGPALARLEVRLTDIEQETRAATGLVEEVTHQLDQINRRLDKLVGDVDYRLSSVERMVSEMQASLEQASAAPQAAPMGGPRIAAVPQSVPVTRAPGDGGGGFATGPRILGTITDKDLRAINPPGGAASSGPGETAARSRAAAVAAEENAVLPPGTPRERYTYAFGLLRQNRFDQAEMALRAFLNAHGDDVLAGNARYWLGETYYVREDFVKAAEVFLEGYQSDPGGTKAPDTLLKLGMSLANLDKRTEACAAFDKLTMDFSDLPGNIVTVVGRERQRSGCN